MIDPSELKPDERRCLLLLAEGRARLFGRAWVGVRKGKVSHTTATGLRQRRLAATGNEGGYQTLALTGEGRNVAAVLQVRNERRRA